jgi:hypothetical protein
VLPKIYGAQLYGFLDGTEVAPEKEITVKDKDGVEVEIQNPDYARWMAQDQSILGFLVRNMAKEVLTQMVGICTSKAVWTAVMEMFLSQSQARVVELRTRLSQCRKEDKPTSMRSRVFQMKWLQLANLGTLHRHTGKGSKKVIKGPEKSAGAAYGSYGFDSNRYRYSGATNHVTGELEKLHVRDCYNGNEQIHTTSGSGMDIRHIGNYVIHTPTHDLHLNDILHVPQASKSLLSTSRLAKDNNAFVEYWPNSFFVKDQDTRKILLQGRCVGGLHPLTKSSAISPS